MKKFRKKPVEIEAIQYQGQNVKGICHCNGRISKMCTDPLPHVHTIHNDQKVYVKVGDWILPEPDGEHFYPVKPDIFEATYEAI